LGRRPCRRPKLQKKDAASIPHAKKKTFFPFNIYFSKLESFTFQLHPGSDTFTLSSLDASARQSFKV